MTNLLLDYPPDKARDVVKEALRRTVGISDIVEGEHQVVGKTGVSFPRILWSYGENIYVDFSDPTDEGKVPIEVWAEKSIWTNITANPQKFKREFLTELEGVRGRPIEDLQHESVEVDEGQPASIWLRRAIGYPISVVVGGFLGILFAMVVMTTFFGRLNDGVGILGILMGAISGGALWYYRGTSWISSVGKYSGLAFIGILLTAVVQTVLNLHGVIGSLLFLAFALGTPLSAYLFDNPTPR
jgi:hypothetical protein